MKLLKPQPLHEKYYEPIEVQLKDLIYRLIFDPLRAVIVSASLPHELKNAKTSALEAALIKGTVQYTEGVFSGKLSASVSAELRKMGARFDKKMKVFKLEPGKVPAGVRVVAANRTMLARKLNENLKLALDKIEEQLPQQIEKTTISYDKTVDRTTGDFKELYRQIEVTPIETDSAKAAMAKAYSERVRPFIKGWADEEILQLRQDMADNALKGYRSEHMIAKIQKRYGASKAKAKFLARQETALFMSNYRKLRFTSAGVKKFKWSTSGDSRVRDDHKALNGRVFDYANPPIIDSATGQHGLPGQGFGCRCVDIAIVEGA
jgi:SPP1 gp7 family putative phage head morphogenesis protein